MIHAIIFAFVSISTCPQAPEDPLAPPTGPGIARQFPRDEGIGRHPSVLLFEDFESESLDAVTGRWTEVSNEGGKVLAFSSDTPVPGAGTKSLQITATPGENTGGHLYRRLPREVDTVFARFYVKFPDPANYIHHFVHIGGYRPATNWPQGTAGIRPTGDDHFTIGIEPFGRDGRAPAPGDWNFYTYWPEMKVSARGEYWGNGITPAPRQPAPAGKWQCVEVMVRLNEPGKRDGSLALWLDGELVADVRAGTPRKEWTGLGFEVAAPGEGEPFEGFAFRTTDELKVNFFWLLHYVTDQSNRRNRSSDPARPNSVWFDHVVVATEYIGPVRAE